MDFLRAKNPSSPWKNENKFKSLISETRIGDQKCLLVFPQTFMNLSGQAAQAVLSFYKISADDLCVAYDDLDLKLGSFKMTDHGPKGHNGVNDIVEKVKGSFAQIRLGVDNRELRNRIAGMDYVLMNFAEDELTMLNETFEAVYAQLVKNGM